jgi:hypothetical protein
MEPVGHFYTLTSSGKEIVVGLEPYGGPSPESSSLGESIASPDAVSRIE